jgi:hypothetical protein
MNFIPGHIVAENDRTWFASELIRIEIPSHGGGPLAPGPVVLGVRPEGVTIAPLRGQPAMTGRVTLTEVIAPDEYATIVVADKSLRARVPAEEVAVGDEVGVSFIPSHLLFFNAETGERIVAPADAPAAPTLQAGVAR